jgi:hypothetical protein
MGGLADQIAELIGVYERMKFYRRYNSTAPQEEHGLAEGSSSY